jgi:5-methylcytosine-specific restriction enzyme A
MIHLFQRIINNDYNWQKPSPGRLVPKGKGDYVKKNGFGHEDWNFNNKYTVDGLMYGYCFYEPTASKLNEQFNFAFAQYFENKWYLVGFYLKSIFVKQVPIDIRVLKRKMKDMLNIKSSLGEKWLEYSEHEFLSKVIQDSQLSKWRVSPGNAIRIPTPVEIPKKLFETKNYHLAKPTQIDKNIFKRLLELGHVELNFKIHDVI